jgi:hypothetical protein
VVTKRAFSFTCACAILVFCITFMFGCSRTSTEVEVKTREQSSTLRDRKVSVSVLVPAAATDKSMAKLRLRLLTENKSLPGDTGVAISITASRSVTLRTSPSFRIAGNIQTNGARSFFMRFRDPETHSASRGFPAFLRLRVATLSARASDTITLRGLNVPMTLTEGVEYRFTLVGSPFPMSDPLPPGNPPAQILYVANSSTGTITSYPLPLPTGSVNMSPTNTIAGISLVLSHGMAVYDTNAGIVPSNQIFVNTTGCNLDLTTCAGSATISVYSKGKSAAPITQYQITSGPENLGAGPPWPTTALAVVSYNGLTQNTQLPMQQYVGANVIDPTVPPAPPSPPSKLTGYMALLGQFAYGSTSPMFLSDGVIVQDVTQTSLLGSSDMYVYTLVGTGLPLDQPSATLLGNVPASNLGVLSWSGSNNYGPILGSVIDYVTKFQNPTSIFASASSYSALSLPLFVTDSGSSTGGTDEVFVFQRQLDSSNSAPWCAISGPDTGLSQPQAAVTDANGNLYVANAGNNSITVYQTHYQNPQSSQGGCDDMVPTTTLYGDTTQLSLPISLAIGSP